MRKTILTLLFAITTLTGLTTATCCAAQFDDVPMAYKGRFPPAPIAADSWLYDLSRQKSLDTDSALKVMWNLHFHGHEKYADTPLFWIDDAQVKRLLGLPLKENRVSYHTLQASIHNNTPLADALIETHYSKAFHDVSNRSRSAKQELASMAPGLWVTARDSELIVLSTPVDGLWSWLETGHRVATQADVRSGPPPRSAIALADSIGELIVQLTQFEQWSAVTSDNPIVSNAVTALRRQGATPQRIAEQLEAQSPLQQRLRRGGPFLRMLPSRMQAGEWLSVSSLALEVYEPASEAMQPVANFTPYSDDLFVQLRDTYLAALTAVASNNDPAPALHHLAAHLQEGYSTLAGTTYREARGKSLVYPSTRQLSLETAYYAYPWPLLTAIAYALGLLLCSMARSTTTKLHRLGMYLLVAAFVAHTGILIARILILHRPPVSNMTETVVYVPWIAMLTGFILSAAQGNRLVAYAGATASFALLTLMHVTGIDSGMENVQAVLDSQYWLIIHVLMVVGSYGIFIVSGLLGHAYLATAAFRGRSVNALRGLSQSILNTMYLGVGLLIPGTVLGGVWAAQSWGRFWDWDPKESWAFISACVYLLVIHLHRYRYIRDFGLAVGSIAGLIAIGFTWYGVNYILGTGLHSYGFGSGGEVYYWCYLAAEILFVLGAAATFRAKNRVTL